MHGVGEEEALVQTKMDPCFYKRFFCKAASLAEVWYKPECSVLLFPLPLLWRAPHPWLPRRRWGSWRGVAATEGGYRKAATASGGAPHPARGFPGADGGAGWPRSGQTEGASTRPWPAAHHFFTIHSYLLLPRSVSGAGEAPEVASLQKASPRARRARQKNSGSL